MAKVRRFTQVPDEWYRMFNKVGYSAAVLAVAILRRSWVRQCRDIRLTNELAKEVGIDRATKLRAAQQLQDVGLIRILEAEVRKSPLIRVVGS